jgi:hypothetical protein
VSTATDGDRHLARSRRGRRLLRRTIGILLDATITLVLWPIAVLFTAVAVAAVGSAGSGRCDAPCDGPYQAAVGVGSVVVLIGWLAYVALCVRRRTTPAGVLISWVGTRRGDAQPRRRTSPHS